MAACPLPWFPIYAAEMLSDERFAVWSPGDRGCWLTLVARCWIDGSIPNDLELLARICGCNADAMRSHWDRIADRFAPCENPARLFSPRVELERDKASGNISKTSNAGRKAALARWEAAKNRDAIALPSHSDRNATGMRSVCPIPVPLPVKEPPIVPPGGDDPVPEDAPKPKRPRKPRERRVDPSRVNRWSDAFDQLGSAGDRAKGHFERLWTLAPRSRAETGKLLEPGSKLDAAMNFATIVASGEDPYVLRAAYGLYLSRNRERINRDGYCQAVSTFFGLGGSPSSKATWQVYLDDAQSWASRNPENAAPPPSSPPGATVSSPSPAVPLSGPIA